VEGTNEEPKEQQVKRPLLFEGFASRDEFEEALSRLERFLSLLKRWDGQTEVLIEFEDPSTS